MADLLKEGAKHLSGLEETVLKNVDAVRKLAKIVRTSLGPNGMNKMVVNHLEKLFVTSDSATIARELEVVHPAAKMIVQAAQQQEAEAGDATNLVISFAGELMTQAEALIRTGLHPSLIVEGYTVALAKALELLDALAVHTVADPRDEVQVARALRGVIGAKQYGTVDIIAPLVARACILACPADTPANFNTDNVRVAKLIGAGVGDSALVRGFVIPRDAEGVIKHVTAAKIAVFQGGIDIAKTETKGTVLVRTAQELRQYSASEEQAVEAAIKAIADAGVTVAISGSSIGELAMHYLERYKIMVVKVLSKFDLRRLCQAVGASPILNVGGALPAAKLGFCDVVTVEEIGSTKCCVFRQEAATSHLATIVVRASTQNTLDDIERAIDDGVNIYRQICRDGRFVAGAGACEIELAIKLASFAEAQPGLEQYAIRKFAEAFEVVPRTLAENAGVSHQQAVSDLYAAHEAGKHNAGVDIESTGSESSVLPDAVEAGVFDHLIVKRRALEFACNTVITILRVDQIIMQKQAGGPKLPQQSGAMDANDPDVA